MKRSWLWCVAAAALGVGALMACDPNGTNDPLRNAGTVAVPSAAAQELEGPKGCSLSGAWMTKPGSSYTPWMATNIGSSESSGTGIIDVPVWPEDLGFPFNPRVILRGAWERTGGNTFAFTAVGWILDASGAPALLAENVGTQTITDDCNKLTVESTMEVLTLDGQSIAKEELPDMVGYRIVVEHR